MAGRGTLLVILGYTILFGLTGRYWTRIATNSVDNFLLYYNETTAHAIAKSAANLGGNQVFVNQPSNHGFHLSGSMSGGEFDVEVDSVNQYELLLTATGTYPPSGTPGSITDTVRVRFGPNRFSTFGLYTGTMSSLSWDTGDTIWGGFHSDGTFNVEGTPVFYGRVTTKNDITGSGTPIIYGSFETGLSIPMPATAVSNIQTAAASGGGVFSNPSTPAPFDVWMTMNSNATVTYHTNLNPSDTTIPLSSLAPNGVIVVNNGNLHIHGTVKGQVTVAAAGSSTTGFGSVYINGNLTCNSDPMTNPGSTDVLGVVAQNSVWVESDNAYLGISPSLPPSNPLIEAAIYAQNGSFRCYYQSRRSYTTVGTVHVYGSISNKYLGVTIDPTGTYGYQPDYRFDPRFSSVAPPSFPVTGTYVILSWYE
jgi:cytoskeletal protein CcmA (bactofilin family)